jgi:hypothetical protein
MSKGKNDVLVSPYVKKENAIALLNRYGFDGPEDVKRAVIACYNQAAKK